MFQRYTNRTQQPKGERMSADQAPNEYFYCGATIDRTDGTVFTCARRVAHSGECSPKHDT